MCRFFLAAVAWMATALAAPGRVPIKPAHHVVNRVASDLDSPGYCQWASWQTLGNCLGVKELRGLTEKRSRSSPGRWVRSYGPWVWDGQNHSRRINWKWVRKSPGPASPFHVRDFLKGLGVKVDLRWGDPDLVWLRARCDDGVGAVCSMRDYPAKGDRHAVYVTDVRGRQGDERVEFYDSNRPGELQLWAGDDFLWHWTGTATTLKRNK